MSRRNMQHKLRRKQNDVRQAARAEEADQATRAEAMEAVKTEAETIGKTKPKKGTKP